MFAALLLLLPAAPLPVPPAKLERKHLAGYEYRICAPWGGKARFHANGNWEHDFGAGYAGSWELKDGVLTVCEVTSYGVSSTYRFELRPGPNAYAWHAERTLTGRMWTEGSRATAVRAVLCFPRRIR